ncbi:hypothetical protein BJ165DRAFT_1513958 [Panaeolus papilionaceus]|nr:hypothetical protein BJ165DRAFT_1513958 [Panaeolus papilionaceus]
MSNAALPNDIIEEIVDILALTRDKEVDDSFQHVKKVSTLSSFCLHLARKHIFAEVKLGTHYGWYHQRPPKELVMLSNQLTFFSYHVQLRSYIRDLKICISDEEMESPVIQGLIYHTLTQLSNLASLRVVTGHTKYNYPTTKPTPYWDLPAESLDSALRTLLLNSKTLTKLDLCCFANITVNDLKYAPNIRHMELNGIPFNEEDRPWTLHQLHHSDTQPSYLEQLESLKITGYDGGIGEQKANFRRLKAHLLSKDMDGLLNIRLSGLKSFGVEVFRISTFNEVLDLLEHQAISALEDLTLQVRMEGWFYPTDHVDGSNDFSRWLNQIILPSQRTLTGLKMEFSLAYKHQDPFAGFCTTLEGMEDCNVLRDLHIRVDVLTDCECTAGDEWSRLSQVLQKETKWKHLQRVRLSVVVAAFLTPGEAMINDLKMLPQTHLKSLSSKHFSFDYSFEILVI